MNFSEYYNKQEDATYSLKEEVATAIIAVLGFTVVAQLILFGATLLFYGNTFTLKKIATLFRKALVDFKDIPNILSGKATVNVKQIVKEPGAVKQRRQLEKINDKYEGELKDLYGEIGRKEFDNARDEYKALHPSIKNNLDVQRAIITKITQVLKEPPLYIRSPGNNSYQAIKKVINIRVAQASAKAVEEAVNDMTKGKEEDEKS